MLFDDLALDWEKAGRELPGIVKSILWAETGRRGDLTVRPSPVPTEGVKPQGEDVPRHRRKGRSGNPAKRAAELAAERRRNGL